MRKFLSVTVLCCLFAGLCHAQMRDRVETFACAAMEGRLAGSDGEKEAAQYFASELKAAGVDLLYENDVFGLKQDNGDTLTSRNVIGYIQGYDRKLQDHYIVIAARLDNLGSRSYTVNGEQRTRIYRGANGNGSGLSMLVELAQRLSINRVLLKRSVLIAAFGSTLVSDAGAWYFVNRSFPEADKIDAMINLEMLGTPSRGFYAYTAGSEDLNDIVRELSQTLQPVHPTIANLEPVSSCHNSFHAAGIPVTMFTSGMYPEYNTAEDTADILEYDGMERELEYIYNYTVALVNRAEAPQQYRTGPKASENGKKPSVPYYDCDVKPAFFNNYDPVTFLEKWVYVYLRYPESAVAQGVQGRVLVDFVVDENGKVCEVEVARGVDQRLDDEAVRVISASPDWKPGRVRGKKVRTKMSVYVEFRLTKNR